MSHETIGAAVLAAGTWAIFTAALLGPGSTPRGPVWVVTGSEMIRSHPELVRAAPPAETVARPSTGDGEGRLPQG